MKLSQADGDLSNALNLILHDLRLRPRRHGRSVVVTSVGVESGETYQNAKNDPIVQEIYDERFQQLFAMGVPFIAAAGNEAPGRPLVDQLPMVLQDDDTPIITVGAADYDGMRASFSQTGQVDPYAPGINVLCQTKRDGSGKVDKGGTSLGKFGIPHCASQAALTNLHAAAPQVGGLVATYLSYAIKPWEDTQTGVERVKVIRKYLKTDASSWIRPAGVDADDPNKSIRVMWNGATKEIHDDAEEVNVDYLPDADLEEEDQSDPEPQPTPEPTPAPEPRNKALQIILQTFIDPLSNDYRLRFSLSDTGVSALCSEDGLLELWPMPGYDGFDEGYSILPGIAPFDDLDGVKCDYECDGSNPGALWCEDRNEPKPENGDKEKKVMIPCAMENRSKNKACNLGDSAVWHEPIARCEW